MSASSPVDGRTARAKTRREQRRALILDAAIRCFSDSGYHKTHVSDIITAAGVARGTFYLYFESKNAIFQELLDDLLTELRAHINGVDTYPGAPPVYDQLLAVVRQILDLAARNRALASIILREAVGLDDETERKLGTFYDTLHTYIRESLENGQAMGLLRELDTDIVATCVLGSIRQVLYRELVHKTEDDIDLDRLAAAILRYNTIGLMRVRTF